jgi:PAS domain S-box-containing protein
MIRVLLVDRSNSRIVSGWCDTIGELSVSLLAETTDLSEALTRYDIVIVHGDPGDSGTIEIVREIRTKNPLIPVIALSDMLDSELAHQVLTAGADYYLWDISLETCQKLLVPVIRNLVQHRKTEEQLVQDNLLMRTIHDASPVAACVIKGHQILWVNAIIPKKLGYTEGELIGSDPIRLFPDEAEHLRIDTGLYEASTEEGWGIVEGLLKRKDGTLINCHLLSRPIDPSDPGKGLIIIGQDITDYVRIRDLLRKSEVRYQDLLDSANSIVLRVDPRGTIRFINNSGAAFFGYTPEELAGKNLVGTILPKKSRLGR